jgi:hypothetical protein
MELTGIDPLPGIKYRPSFSKGGDTLVVFCEAAKHDGQCFIE